MVIKPGARFLRSLTVARLWRETAQLTENERHHETAAICLHIAIEDAHDVPLSEPEMASLLANKAPAGSDAAIAASFALLARLEARLRAEAVAPPLLPGMA